MLQQRGGTSDVAGGSEDASRGLSSGGNDLHPVHRPMTWLLRSGDAEARQGDWDISQR